MSSSSLATMKSRNEHDKNIDIQISKEEKDIINDEETFPASDKAEGQGSKLSKAEAWKSEVLSVSESNHFDVFLSFHGSETIDKCKCSPPCTVRKLAEAVNALLTDFETTLVHGHLHVFLDSACIQKVIDTSGSISKAIAASIVSTNLGGVAVHLVSKNYLNRIFPLVEYSAFQELLEYNKDLALLRPFLLPGLAVEHEYKTHPSRIKYGNDIQFVDFSHESECAVQFAKEIVDDILEQSTVRMTSLIQKFLKTQEHEKIRLPTYTKLMRKQHAFDLVDEFVFLRDFRSLMTGERIDCLHALISLLNSAIGTELPATSRLLTSLAQKLGAISTTYASFADVLHKVGASGQFDEYNFNNLISVLLQMRSTERTHRNDDAASRLQTCINYIVFFSFAWNQGNALKKGAISIVYNQMTRVISHKRALNQPPYPNQMSESPANSHESSGAEAAPANPAITVSQTSHENPNKNQAANFATSSPAKTSAPSESSHDSQRTSDTETRPSIPMSTSAFPQKSDENPSAEHAPSNSVIVSAKVSDSLCLSVIPNGKAENVIWSVKNALPSEDDVSHTIDDSSGDSHVPSSYMAVAVSTLGGLRTAFAKTLVIVSEKIVSPLLGLARGSVTVLSQQNSFSKLVPSAMTALANAVGGPNETKCVKTLVLSKRRMFRISIQIERYATYEDYNKRMDTLLPLTFVACKKRIIEDIVHMAELLDLHGEYSVLLLRIEREEATVLFDGIVPVYDHVYDPIIPEKADVYMVKTFIQPSSELLRAAQRDQTAISWNQFLQNVELYSQSDQGQGVPAIVNCSRCELPRTTDKAGYCRLGHLVVKKQAHDEQDDPPSSRSHQLQAPRLQLGGGKANRASFSADGAYTFVCSATSPEFWLFDVASGRRVRAFKGHTRGGVKDVKWSADELRALSGGQDGTVRVWNVASARCTTELQVGGLVVSVAWWSNDHFVVAGLANGTIEVWDIDQRQRTQQLKGYAGRIVSHLDISADQTHLLSASVDKTIRLWKLASAECVHTLEGHTSYVNSAVLSRDGRRALSASSDKTVRLWDLGMGRCIRVLEGHTSQVVALAWHPSDMSLAVSGSYDNTVRVWNVNTGACLGVLEGHHNSVRWYFHWSSDGQYLTSCDHDGQIVSTNLAAILAGPTAAADQVEYTNAKVLLVGDSGAGKTGLSMRLAKNEWGKSDATVSAWSTRWSLGAAQGVTGTGEREIWLWDFGGQHDQRLVHQLFMDDAALAVLVFDGQRDNVLDTLRQWDRDIARASHAGCRKLLVAGRVDAGAPRMSRKDLEEFAKDNGFQGYFETSAKTGLGCNELKAAIAREINWAMIPWRSSPAIFKLLKDGVIALKDAAVSASVETGKVSGNVLLRFDELRDALSASHGSNRFTDEQLKAVLSLLAGAGVVWELKFGGYYLLHPELVGTYMQGLLRQDRLQFGYARESDVFAGVLPENVPRLDDATKDRLLLLELHHTLLERALCYREVTKDKESILIFPARFTADPPKKDAATAVIVSYTFGGYADEAYATLVVRLHHTETFRKAELFRDFAQFETPSGRIGIKIKRLAPADPIEFEVFSERTVAGETVILFCTFVHEHLLQYVQEVTRLRHFSCSNCGLHVQPLGAMTKIAMYVESVKLNPDVKKPSAICTQCDEPVELWDALEEHYARSDFRSQVRDIQKYSKEKIQRQAAERVLIASIISLVLQAGHDVKELPMPELGANLKVTLKPAGTCVMVVLGAPENLRGSGKARFFDNGSLQFAPDWAVRKLNVVLVLSVKGRDIGDTATIQWTPLSGVHIEHQRVGFQGRRLDVDAVRGWKDLPKSTVEEGLGTLTLTDPVEPIPWTQRDRRNDVFVSFRGGDLFGTSTVRHALALPLAAALRPLAVFFDDHGLNDMMVIAPGVTIDGILQGLLSTQGGGVVAVLITPTFFKRKWPTLELAIAYALHEAGQVRLLPFLLGKVTASSVETQPFVQQVCKGLKDVRMIAVHTVDPHATVAFIKTKIEGTLALQRGVAGGTAAVSFSALKIRIAMKLKNDATSQDILAEALLNRPRRETETLMQALAESEIAPENVSQLRDAMAMHFTTPDHRPLVQLVESYQFKWHQTPLSVAVADSVVGTVKARVEQWWKDNPASD